MSRSSTEIITVIHVCYLRGGGGGWPKALVVGSVSLWRRLLAFRP